MPEIVEVMIYERAARRAIGRTVESAFEKKLVLQKAELSALEREVEELRDLLRKRETARDEVIARRVQELTGDDEHLEW